MFKVATAVQAAVLVAVCVPGTLALGGQPSLEEMGKKQFIRCSSCHALSAQARPSGPGADVGLHLEGIVGRRVAAVEGFAYSEALRAEDFVWDEEMLDKWLERPQDVVPGMCIPYRGLARPELRKALIAYLKKPGPESTDGN